jgi:hypothetical protein
VHLGLRALNPWLDETADVEEGANYAVPGGTALTSINPLGLPQQVSWHLDLVNFSGSSQIEFHNGRRLPNASTLRDALYAIHIGGLDYKYFYDSAAFPPDLVRSAIVPIVVAEIRTALEVQFFLSPCNTPARRFNLAPRLCLPSKYRL